MHWGTVKPSEDWDQQGWCTEGNSAEETWTNTDFWICGGKVLCFVVPISYEAENADSLLFVFTEMCLLHTQI